MKLLIPFLLAASGLAAAPEWLSFHYGLRFGMGGSAYVGPERPAPGGAFAALSPQSTQGRFSVTGGDFGAGLALGWKRRIELQAELLGIIDGSRNQEDLGGGQFREVVFTRNSLELPLSLRASYFTGWGLRPFALAGLWGNRMILSGRRVTQPGQPEQLVDWPGAPAEDWGWMLGAGADYRVAGGLILGADVRYREGQKNLDPNGFFMQRARTITLAVLVGF